MTPLLSDERIAELALDARRQTIVNPDIDDLPDNQAVIAEAIRQAVAEAGEAAAKMCDEKANAIFNENPGRTKGSVSSAGGFAGHLVKDCARDIRAALTGQRGEG